MSLVLPTNVPSDLTRNSHAPSRKARGIAQDIHSSLEDSGGRMCSFEGIHQRQDQRNAQEESQRRYTIKNTNDSDNDTLTVAFCIAHQVRPTHYEPDALPHRQQRKAQSCLLALRHICLLRRRRYLPARDALKTPTHHAAHDAGAQGTVVSLVGGIVF